MRLFFPYLLITSCSQYWEVFLPCFGPKCGLEMIQAIWMVTLYHFNLLSWKIMIICVHIPWCSETVKHHKVLKRLNQIWSHSLNDTEFSLYICYLCMVLRKKHFKLLSHCAPLTVAEAWDPLSGAECRSLTDHLLPRQPQHLCHLYCWTELSHMFSLPESSKTKYGLFVCLFSWQELARSTGCDAKTLALISFSAWHRFTSRTQQRKVLELKLRHFPFSTGFGPGPHPWRLLKNKKNIFWGFCV